MAEKVNITRQPVSNGFRALDETSIAAQQPVEQLDRVQRVSDAWQTQVLNAFAFVNTV